MPHLETMTRMDPAPLLRTRAGLPKRRLSLDDLLELLGTGESREATLSRLEEYQRLFAYRFTGAIVTEKGGGPGNWTKYYHPLELRQIALHLMGDRIPGRPPVWYGARSFEKSMFFCLDVDANLTPEQLLAKKYPEHERMPDFMKANELRKVAHQLATRPAKPPLEERLAQVNRALRRLGINPDNHRSVLTLGSPSGGKHIYVFFDAAYHLQQYAGLFNSAGLRHVSGEIEFYPATNQGLRLPFGCLPGQPHDPRAWIQFIDDYRNGQVIRHTLADLHDRLASHRSVQYRRIESRKTAYQTHETPQPTPPDRNAEANIIQPAQIHSDKEGRFLQLLDGIHSPAEAEELLELGILIEGKRTAVLKHLTAHLIWFKDFSAEDAAAFLTAWATSPRHSSKDIAADLENGTTIVADHIATMCRWYADNSTRTHKPNDRIKEFSHWELDSILRFLKDLSSVDRANQAHFLLHFLRFAKRHGASSNDGQGWEASPAIRQVIRRWPGCHHMNYATRLNHAISGGYMEVVNEAWHHPNGSGRARTYRLSVAVVPESEWVMTYEAAFTFLMETEPTSSSSTLTQLFPPWTEETSHAAHPDRTAPGGPADSDRRALPSPIPSACS